MFANRRYFKFLSQHKSVYLKPRVNNGFTVVELMITLAISAIVLSVGVPGFTSIIQNNRQTTLLNEFTSYFHFAKTIAVTQGTSVTLCARNTAGTNCDDSGSWDDGWIVFVDVNGDGDVDSDDDLLKVQEAIVDDINITSSSSSSKVKLNAKGFISSASTFTFCDSRGASYAKAKILSKTGRMRTSTTSLSCS